MRSIAIDIPEIAELKITIKSLFEVFKLTNDNSKNNIKKKLTPLQFHVTQRCGTEPPFHNEFWNNKKTGIYVDVVSREPLFSSLDKFDSGTG